MAVIVPVAEYWHPPRVIFVGPLTAISKALPSLKRTPCAASLYLNAFLVPTLIVSPP